MERESIAILDFGSQYTQLIARRVRELGVYSRILPYNTTARQLSSDKPQGIILSGGPMSVTDAGGKVTYSESLMSLGIPILGICYGMQILALHNGGAVSPSNKREYGRADLDVVNEGSLLFSCVPKRSTVWMSHGDTVEKIPPGQSVLARTDSVECAAMGDIKKHVYGLQFHPEVAHTEYGTMILENFLKKICGCSCTWNMSSFIEDSVAAIKKKVGSKTVVCGLSGGVDSSVAAVLTARAVGDRLTCIFVNNGLLRKDEHTKVMDTFERNMRLNVIMVDATERFLKKLAGVTDPERKRKIIGHEFIEVFEKEARALGAVDVLLQGTLYPDVIESRSPFGGPSATIKSHHNVGGLPEKLNFKLLEPLKDLFKDEVRMVGLELGIPEEIVYRQPFPGPGLAVRIIGDITREQLDLLRECDAVIVEEIKKAGLYRSLWQSFGVLLPIKTVGVMGDERTYENTVAVRAVTSSDGMTADWAKVPYDVLDRISNRIINNVKGVNRVVYDISSKPPSTIEWE